MCSYCSSNNEDSTDICFVCGSSRTKEEIRIKKIEKRKEVEKNIIANIYNILRIIFIISAVVCFVGVLLILTDMILNHDAQFFWNNFLRIIESMRMNIELYLFDNFKSIFSKTENNWGFLCKNTLKIFMTTADNIGFYFVKNIVGIVQRIVENINSLTP